MEALIVVHVVLVCLSVSWLYSVSCDVLRAMQINSNFSKVIEEFLKDCFLIREANNEAGTERRVNLADAMLIYNSNRVESVVRSDIGVIRIKFIGGHFMVGYDSQEICRRQLAPHLHERYIGIPDLDCPAVVADAA